MFVKYVLVDKDCKYGWKSDKQIPGNSYSRCIQNPKIFKKKTKMSPLCVLVWIQGILETTASSPSCPELALSLFRVFNQHHDTASSTPKLGNFNDCESFVLRAVSRNGHTVWTCAFLRGEGSCRQCGNGLTAE